MGRPKRKSEGDLPTAKRQTRRADDQHEEPESSHAENEYSDDQNFVTSRPSEVKHVKKSAPKSRKSEPVKRIERSDGAEQDIGLLGSQQLGDLVTKKDRDRAAAAKASADFKTLFNSTVEGDEKALNKQVETLSRESAKRDLDFLDTFRSAFMASRPRDPPAENSTRGKDPSTPMVFASLRGRSKLLLSNATDIIAEFEKVDIITSKIEMSDLIDVKEVEESTSRTQEVIEIGCRVGMERYEKMLAGDRSRVVYEQELDEKTAEDYYPSKQFENFVGWGDVAKDAEKYNRRLLKALPAKVVRVKS